MKIHLFNPEHDIALAANLKNFTAPHAGRQLRYDMGYLPALWASGDDRVAVDDEAEARRALQRLAQNVARQGGRLPADAVDRLVSIRKRSVMAAAGCVEPWGWDPALRALLLRRGVAPEVLPSDEAIEQMRQLSHRRTAAMVLRRLLATGHMLVGEACECDSVEAVEHYVGQHRHVVLKAPWSSSGRGLRFVDADGHGLSIHRGWLHGVLSAQGSVMAEPQYNKVKDVGLEFESRPDGTVVCCGLSLFHTANGAYTGNMLATEGWKRQALARYVPLSLLDSVQQLLCQVLAETLAARYVGPLGVDMMIVAAAPDASALQTSHAPFMLHPCVEINLRRTMGHVALQLVPLLNARGDDDVVRVMRMTFAENHYKLTITRL